MSPRVLVTGAAGFIASHVAEALVARGDEVVALDNFDPFYPRAVKERNLETLRRSKGCRFVEADIVRDPLPLDGVSVVVHLAARPGVRPSLEDPASYSETNVTGTVRVLEAARRVGIRRVVFGSSSSVYGDTTPAPFSEEAPAVEPISPYAASKRAGELAHGELVGVADVRRVRPAALEQPHDALDQVVHVAERAGLRPVAVHGERIALDRLHDEVRHHPAVLGAHAWPVRVEDADDARIERVVPMIRHGHRLARGRSPGGAW